MIPYKGMDWIISLLSCLLFNFFFFQLNKIISIYFFIFAFNKYIIKKIRDIKWIAIRIIIFTKLSVRGIFHNFLCNFLGNKWL